MRWSQTLIPTQKQDPADATIASHKLLVRGGFVRQLQAGVYDFLPLGWRSMRKVMAIIHEEMQVAGSVEVSLPLLQPIDLWNQTGRNADYGPDMLRVEDRKKAINALAPTHEEAITEMIAAYVNSYKQLPLNLYQIQTKFRDEPRPRSGLLRVREFLMKDAYSFDATEAGLDEQYQRMFAAYERIYTRCGIPAVPVEAESGPIGGSASHEFTVPCDAGEDIILTSDKGNYAANVEKAETGERPWSLDSEPTGDLEVVSTPGQRTIEEVGKFLKVKPRHLLKTLIFSVRGGETVKWLLAVVRGDHEVNETKLLEATRREKLLGPAATISPADEAEARAAGFAIGFVGPHVLSKRSDSVLVADYDAVQSGHFWVAGGNAIDKHVKHFDWKRDFLGGFSDVAFKKLEAMLRNYPNGPDSVTLIEERPAAIRDIRNAVAGDPSPKNDGGVLRESRGVEVGHVFKLGTKYSEKLGANFLNKDNKEQPVLMGCYGIGVGRIMLSAVEVFHDDRGIIWPVSIAPYEVVITPIKYEGDAKAKADALYDELKRRGVDVLLDDRDDRPGSKFADADLIGIPLRIVVGDRGLANGVVELKERKTGDTQEVPADGVIDRVMARLEALRQSLPTAGGASS